MTSTPEARFGTRRLSDARERGNLALARYERGHRLPSLDVVEAYETELGVVARSLVALHERAGLDVYGLRI